MTGAKQFVGFGFGAIQSGLFLYEAHRSGSFETLTVADVDAELIEALRAAGGFFTVNRAHRDGVTAARVGPVTIYNPTIPEQGARLVERLAQADEAATAVPSVSFYGDGPGSIADCFARALEERTKAEPLIIYAAENHNRAAEILADEVAAQSLLRGDRGTNDNAAYCNTVIGKMSGIIRGREAIEKLRLAPVVPGWDRAFLVEEFNRILISRPPRGRRALSVFAEKADLLPFEEAKLYGHNAAHALLGFLAQEYGCSRIAQVPEVEGLLSFVHEAFTQEAGAALIAKYQGRDELFTTPGFTAYAEDLLDRMTRASLHDTVERVVRDPARKLGYEDRFIGTLRTCRSFAGGGDRFAFGAACAFAGQFPEEAPDPEHDLYRALTGLWEREDEDLREPLNRAWRRFHDWRRQGRPPLPAYWRDTAGHDDPVEQNA